MPAPLNTAEAPEVVAWSNETGAGLIFRNGSDFAREFGKAWKARGAAERAEFAAKQARRAALPSLTDQVAALAASRNPAKIAADTRAHMAKLSAERQAKRVAA